MIVHWFFNWLNFGILIFLGRYVFVRWFAAAIHKSIQLDMAKLPVLQQKLVDLENQVQEVSLDLILQQHKATNLTVKLARWQSEFEVNRLESDLELKSLQARLYQQNLIKKNNLALGLVQNDTLKTIVHQAANLLQINYADQVQAQYFVDQALTKLGQE